MAELLFWPALLAYSEAAVAYLNDARHPGTGGRLATWGVRIGWLVQTALLGVQAARADGFPWSTWAGSLNLFVWLVVGAYLIWGCQPRYRLLGLAVLPLAVVLFLLARIGGGTGIGDRSHYSNVFLVLHVGLVLAAFAGFTLAAALSALYLWQERRLKRRESSILRLHAPALARLDDVAARTIAFALPALTLGIAVGVVRLREHGGVTRRADGRHHRHLDGVRRLPRLAPPRRLARPPRGVSHPRRLRARCRSAPGAPRHPLRDMSIVLVGISHHKAPVELRERAALDPKHAGELARTLAGDNGEAVCLSTCNRTELYLADESADAAEEKAEAALLALESELGPALYRLRGDAAALHLFRVAAGLDSMIPGEGEILGQVRAAHDGGATGPLLDRLFRQALQAGRKARTQTAIGESPASVSSAAAALAEQVFGDLRDRSILVIGAGKTGELAIRNLVSRGASIAFVANRTGERAEELTERFGGEALPLARIEDELARADVVLSSTSAPGWVLTREQVERTLPARKGRPLFLIDLAVPRDLEPTIHELDGCYLYDIDDLEAVVAETLAGRRREAERAETIVAEEADRFRAWQASLEVVPAITSLRARAEQIRDAELRRAKLNDAERRAAESVTAAVSEQTPASADHSHETGSRSSRRRDLC